MRQNESEEHKERSAGGPNSAFFAKDKVGTDKIQLVTISRPSAYGEYEPYHFCDTEDEFERTVAKM